MSAEEEPPPATDAASVRDAAVRRLNWGCGPHPMPGWINSDRVRVPGVDPCCDIRDGLPLPTGSIDYAVAMHVLQDVAWADLPAVVRELLRVLRPGGTLRLGLPDLDRAIDAYRRGDDGYFHVPDEDARTLGAKLVTQIVWYGSVRTPFTYDFAGEILTGAGFRAVARCAFGVTASAHPEIVTLDNRERESLFVEAVR